MGAKHPNPKGHEGSQSSRESMSHLLNRIETGGGEGGQERPPESDLVSCEPKSPIKMIGAPYQFTHSLTDSFI